MITTSSVRLEWSSKSLAPPLGTPRLERTRTGHPSATLVHGDNLAALTALRPRCEKQPVMLAYLDPPFLTGRKHHGVRRKRTEGGKVVREPSQGFDDRWESLDAYLDALAPRIAAARELLAPEGCLVLHVDPKTSHYAKVLCDQIFGAGCFASEIVWRYRRWPAKTPNFQRVHDVLLRYVRDPDVRPRFHQLYEPLAPSTLATWGTRKQRAVVDGDGRRTRSSKTEDRTPGAPLGDVWEIGIVAPVARERTGYPTQKPEALLERLVLACTAEGELVIDPYAGSGTTLAVCARLGRAAIGIDDNPVALDTARARLAAHDVHPHEERVLLGGPRSARRPRRRSHAA